MKRKFTFAMLMAVVLLTGCWQKSVYPFYKDKDVYFDEKLLGTWREDKSDDPASWKIVTTSTSKTRTRSWIATAACSNWET
jgi:hypothetical protein